MKSRIKLEAQNSVNCRKNYGLAENVDLILAISVPAIPFFVGSFFDQRITFSGFLLKALISTVFQVLLTMVLEQILCQLVWQSQKFMIKRTKLVILLLTRPLILFSWAQAFHQSFYLLNKQPDPYFRASEKSFLSITGVFLMIVFVYIFWLSIRLIITPDESNELDAKSLNQSVVKLAGHFPSRDRNQLVAIYQLAHQLMLKLYDLADVHKVIIVSHFLSERENRPIELTKDNHVANSLTGFKASDTLNRNIDHSLIRIIQLLLQIVRDCINLRPELDNGNFYNLIDVILNGQVFTNTIADLITVSEADEDLLLFLTSNDKNMRQARQTLLDNLEKSAAEVLHARRQLLIVAAKQKQAITQAEQTSREASLLLALHQDFGGKSSEVNKQSMNNNQNRWGGEETEKN